MLYLMSDIHGDLKAFQKMLKPWIEEGIATVCMGNHEMFMSMWLRGKLPDYKWMAFGGEETLKIVKNYSFEQKKELLDFLEGLPIYIERSAEVWEDCDHTFWNSL